MKLVGRAQYSKMIRSRTAVPKTTKVRRSRRAAPGEDSRRRGSRWAIALPDGSANASRAGPSRRSISIIPLPQRGTRMPRPIWKGAISFGLVTIPVALYPATESRRPSFRQLRRDDNSRIRYRRVAESDGAEVPLDDIVKGFEVEKDRYVVFTDSPTTWRRRRQGSRPIGSSSGRWRRAASWAWPGWRCASGSTRPHCARPKVCCSWRPCTGPTRSVNPPSRPSRNR